MSHLKIRFQTTVVSLFQHFIALLFPLFVTVLLSRRLSIEVWGELLWLQAIAVFTSLFMTAGSEILGTICVSKKVETAGEVQEVFFNILSLRLFNILIILIPVSILTYSTDYSFISFQSFFLAAMLSINSYWFYVTMNRALKVTGVEALIRLAFLITIYFAIRNDATSFAYIPILISMNAMIGLYHIAITLRDFEFRLEFLKLNWAYYRQLISLFSIQFFTQIYSQVPLLIIGWYFGNTMTAIYGNADRVYKLLRTSFLPVSRNILAYFLITKNQRSNHERNGFIFSIFLGIIYAGVVHLGADYVVTSIYGEKYISAAKFLAILGLAIPFTFGSSYIFNSMILPNSAHTPYLVFLLFLALILMVSIFLGAVQNAMGITWLVVASEAVIFLFLFFHRILLLHREKD